jgi:hypothetical protein
VNTAAKFDGCLRDGRLVMQLPLRFLQYMVTLTSLYPQAIRANIPSKVVGYCYSLLQHDTRIAYRLLSLDLYPCLLPGGL